MSGRLLTKAAFRAGRRTGSTSSISGIRPRRARPSCRAKFGCVRGDMWRKIGLDIAENLAPNTFGNAGGPEVVQWPGLALTGRGAAEIALSQFQTKQIPNAENRWTGQNTGSYSNPALDKLFDQVYGTLDANERANLLKQVGDAMAAELPALPIYWRISFMELRNTVNGPLADNHAHMGQDINGYNL